MLLQVDEPSAAAATAQVGAVSAVTAVEARDEGLLVHVCAPYEGQLAFVLDQLRLVPGLRALRFLTG